ncbi:hypothetical protein C1646_714648 [Rhizophagus diaphanus]|nr:hypothetical protein C1646_714648 [Rhizophagus diaphanus] [Rhizophagus sp. MUCL 43196]
MINDQAYDIWLYNSCSTFILLPHTRLLFRFAFIHVFMLNKIFLEQSLFSSICSFY